MKTELLVDGPAFWTRLEPDLGTAQKRVFAQTMTFEGDNVGGRLANALAASRADDRRMVIDEFTKHVVSDKFIYHPKHLADRDLWDEVRSTRRMLEGLAAAGVGLKFTNKAGWLFLHFPIRNHKKLVAIDGCVAYIGGINFSQHNFDWHDMMLRIDDPEVVAFLEEDFEWTWRGVHQVTSRSFDGMELHVLGGSANERQFGFVLDAIAGAEEEIFVESPYLGPPFSEALRAASLRGVRVVMVMPETSNWKLCQDHILWKAETAPIELRLYPGRMIHLKAMLIDRRFLIVGSANFVLWSYRFQQEYLCAITDPALVAEFRERVMLPDLALARHADRKIGPVWGPLADLGMQWLERITLAANGRRLEPPPRRAPGIGAREQSREPV